MSATTSSVPFDHMFLTSIWIETMLFGLNCAVFGTAIYILSGRHKKSSEPSNCSLIALSVFFFSLSTAYHALCFRQLLEAFIWASPGTASLYFKNRTTPLAVTKLILYSLNVSAQNLFLIWRLWGLWCRKWYAVVLPLLLEIVHIISQFIAIGIGAQTHLPREKGLYVMIIRQMSILNWCMDLCINIGVTLAIAWRLWSMARELGPEMPGKQKCIGVMRMMLECGFLFATATLVTVSIYLSGSVATVNAIDSIMQLATITPLLIIVRVGLGLTSGQRKIEETHDVDTKMEFVVHSQFEVASRHDSDFTDTTHTDVRRDGIDAEHNDRSPV